MQIQKNLVVIVEDDETQRNDLDRAVRRALLGTPSETTTDVLVSPSVRVCLDSLVPYSASFPHASMCAFLDYNMGKNPSGEKRPTELLFKPELNGDNPAAGAFTHFLHNPGVVVFHTGYSEQLGALVPELVATYPHVAFLSARKGPDLPVSRLARVVAFADAFDKVKSRSPALAGKSAYDALREKAASCGYDFRRIFAPR